MNRRAWGICAGLAAWSVVVFWPIVRHDFVNLDDDVLIRDNADFNPVTLHGILRYTRGPYYGGAFPVTYWLFGALTAVAPRENGIIQPGLFHATSLVLHAACVVLVFLIVQKLLRGHDWAAALGTAVFAVHPLQVEVVAWATNINTLLQAMFSLLAVYLYVAYAQEDESAPPRRRWMLYGAATVAFVVAMWSKPLAVTIPLVVAAIDLWWIRRDWRAVAGPVAIWLVLALPVALITRAMLPPPEDVYSPVWARPIGALDALAFYMGKLLLPTGISVDYGRAPRWLLGNPAFYVTWIAPVGVAIALRVARKRTAPLAAAAAVFVAPLLPVLGLSAFHSQRFSTVSDRYLYVSMLGVTMAVAWAVSKTSGRAGMIVVMAWVGVLSAWTRVEVTKWSDTETLFQTTLRRNPSSIPANSVLGFIATQRGDAATAEAYYRAALKTDPGHPASLFNLGNLIKPQGRVREAIEMYRLALKRAPRNAKIHNNLGIALFDSGEFDAAVASFEAAVRFDPGWAEARANLERARALRERAATDPASRPTPIPR